MGDGLGRGKDAVHVSAEDAVERGLGGPFDDDAGLSLLVVV